MMVWKRLEVDRGTSTKPVNEEEIGAFSSVV